METIMVNRDGVEMVFSFYGNFGAAEIQLAIKPDFTGKAVRWAQFSNGRSLRGSVWHGERTVEDWVYRDGGPLVCTKEFNA